jgi:phosphoribosylpyrophosphate synthetase
MNVHGKDIKIFCGNANRPFAEQIARSLGLPLGDMQIKTFSDGEIALSINESVRGSDVFVVQSTCHPVNNNLMELLIAIDAFKRASAGRITAVIPYFGYARQDRKAKARDHIAKWSRFSTLPTGIHGLPANQSFNNRIILSYSSKFTSKEFNMASNNVVLPT